MRFRVRFHKIRRPRLSRLLGRRLFSPKRTFQRAPLVLALGAALASPFAGALSISGDNQSLTLDGNWGDVYTAGGPWANATLTLNNSASMTAYNTAISTQNITQSLVVTLDGTIIAYGGPYYDRLSNVVVDAFDTTYGGTYLGTHTVTLNGGATVEARGPGAESIVTMSVVGSGAVGTQTVAINGGSLSLFSNSTYTLDGVRFEHNALSDTADQVFTMSGGTLTGTAYGGGYLFGVHRYGAGEYGDFSATMTGGTIDLNGSNLVVGVGAEYAGTADVVLSGTTLSPTQVIVESVGATDGDAIGIGARYIGGLFSVSLTDAVNVAVDSDQYAQGVAASNVGSVTISMAGGVDGTPGIDVYAKAGTLYGPSVYGGATGIAIEYVGGDVTVNLADGSLVVSLAASYGGATGDAAAIDVYDANNADVTLTDMTTSAVNAADGGDAFGVSLADIHGTAAVTLSGGSMTAASYNTDATAYGVRVMDATTTTIDVSGGNSLTAISGYAAGIWVYDQYDAIVDGATVNVSGASTLVDAQSYQGAAGIGLSNIDTVAVTVDAATVQASADTAGYYAWPTGGIYVRGASTSATITLQNDATVEVDGPLVAGINVGDSDTVSVTLDQSSVIAGRGGDSYGATGIRAYGSGDVTVDIDTAPLAAGSLVSVSGYAVARGVDAVSGTFDLAAGASTFDIDAVFTAGGISAETTVSAATVVLSGSTMTVDGGDGAYGVTTAAFTNTSVTLSGGASITATAETNGNGYYYNNSTYTGYSYTTYEGNASGVDAVALGAAGTASVSLTASSVAVTAHQRAEGVSASSPLADGTTTVTIDDSSVTATSHYEDALAVHAAGHEVIVDLDNGASATATSTGWKSWGYGYAWTPVATGVQAAGGGYAGSSASVSLANASQVSATSYYGDATGLDVSGFDTVGVTLTGSGVSATSSYYSAVAVDAYDNGDVTVLLDDAIVTADNGAAIGVSVSGADSVDFGMINGSQVNVSGSADSTGIAIAGVDAVVGFDILSGSSMTVATTSGVASGIYMEDIGANFLATVDTTGTIGVSTDEGDAFAFMLNGLDDRAGVAHRAVTLNVDNATVEAASTGTDWAGVGLAIVDASAATMDVDTVTIAATGDNAYGIGGRDDGSFTLTLNGGSIAATAYGSGDYGGFAHGVSILDNAGAATVGIDGTLIDVDATEDAFGVAIAAGGAVGLTIENGAVIDAYASAADYSGAAGAWISGAAGVTVTLDAASLNAEIDTAGPNSAAHGLHVLDTDGDVLVTASGASSVSGTSDNWRAFGAQVENTTGRVDVDLAGGSVLSAVSNADASGFYLNSAGVVDLTLVESNITADSGGDARGVHVYDADTVSVSLSTSSIESYGYSGYVTGIEVFGAADTTLSLAGSGINATSYAYTASGVTTSGGDSVSITLAGASRIDAYGGYSAKGVRISGAGDADIMTDVGGGAISATSSQGGAVGISLTDIGSNIVLDAAALQVTASGAQDATGLHVDALDLDTVNVNRNVTIALDTGSVVSGTNSAGDYTGRAVDVANANTASVDFAASSVYAQGASAYGISLDTLALASVTLNDVTFVTTASSDVARGIDLASTAGGAMVDITGGTLTVDGGSEALGVAVANGGTVSLTVDGGATIDVYAAEANGNDAAAAVIDGADGATVVIDDAVLAGTLGTTAGSGSDGLGLHVLNTTGDVSISLSGAATVTGYGANLDGIGALVVDTGNRIDIDLTEGSTLAGSSDNAAVGLAVETAAVLDLMLDASSVTGADGAVGVGVRAYAVGSMVVTLDGSTVSGDGDNAGFGAYLGDATSMTVTLDNASTVSGNSAQSYAAGVVMFGADTGTLTLSGGSRVEGDSYNYRGFALYAADVAALTLDLSGGSSAAGLSAYGDATGLFAINSATTMLTLDGGSTVSATGYDNAMAVALAYGGDVTGTLTAGSSITSGVAQADGLTSTAMLIDHAASVTLTLSADSSVVANGVDAGTGYALGSGEATAIRVATTGGDVGISLLGGMATPNVVAASTNLDATGIDVTGTNGAVTILLDDGSSLLAQSEASGYAATGIAVDNADGLVFDLGALATVEVRSSDAGTALRVANVDVTDIAGTGGSFLVQAGGAATGIEVSSNTTVTSTGIDLVGDTLQVDSGGAGDARGIAVTSGGAITLGLDGVLASAVSNDSGDAYGIDIGGNNGITSVQAGNGTVLSAGANGTTGGATVIDIEAANAVSVTLDGTGNTSLSATATGGDVAGIDVYAVTNAVTVSLAGSSYVDAYDVTIEERAALTVDTAQGNAVGVRIDTAGSASIDLSLADVSASGDVLATAIAASNTDAATVGVTDASVGASATSAAYGIHLVNVATTSVTLDNAVFSLDGVDTAGVQVDTGTQSTVSLVGTMIGATTGTGGFHGIRLQDVDTVDVTIDGSAIDAGNATTTAVALYISGATTAHVGLTNNAFLAGSVTASHDNAALVASGTTTVSVDDTSGISGGAASSSGAFNAAIHVLDGETTVDNAGEVYSESTALQAATGAVAFFNNLAGGRLQGQQFAAAGDVTVDNHGLLIGRLDITQLTSHAGSTLYANLDVTTSFLSAGDAYWRISGDATIEDGTTMHLALSPALADAIEADTDGYEYLMVRAGGTLTANTDNITLEIGPLLDAEFMTDLPAGDIGVTFDVYDCLEAGLSGNGLAACLAGDAGLGFDFDVTGNPETWVPVVSDMVRDAPRAAARLLTAGVRQRLASVKGLNGGDDAKGYSAVWVDGRVTQSAQDAQGQVAGFDADGSALTFGGDMSVTDGFRAGFAVTSARSAADETLTANTLDSDATLFSLYGKWESGNTVIETVLGTGNWNNDQVRYADAERLTARFDSAQTGASLWLRQGWGRNGWQFEPQLGALYQRLAIDAYSELGNETPSTKALLVGEQAYEEGEIGLGVLFSKEVRLQSGGTVTPNVELMYWNDVVEDQTRTNAAFLAGSPTFVTTGMLPTADRTAAALGLEYVAKNGLRVEVSADVTMKDNFVGQAMSARLEYRY